MTPQRYEEVRQLFFEVCDLDLLQRSAVLDERCAHDSDLRCEVEALLNEEQDVILTDSRAGILGEIAARTAAQTAESMPQSIGRYRLNRLLGEGGMGRVFEAVQENPRRTVAVKIVRPGIVSEPMLRRFAHEAHMLGRLRHPGIAQIHEAATTETDSGVQPFFVMEMVNGRPLLQFADEKHLSVRERLRLMAMIADAVHHAHTKGVIHRDLKPSNILVDESCDPPQPKILDFGVARATDSDVRATTIQTSAGQIIGTLPYMSPEQASGDSDQVDTRSDVYALGVICYELLSGQLPYDLHKARLHEAARIIREQEPARLSSVQRALRGDVETIVAKALQKDKERRYQSAADFAADIRRYLNDEPIVARPASTMYQIRKFAKRNKALVGGVLGIMVTLILGIGATGYWLFEAIQQRDLARAAQTVADRRLHEVTAANSAAQVEAEKARTVTEIFQRMIAAAGPQTSGGRDRTIRDLLGEVADESVVQYAKYPELRAAVEMTLGAAFMELGEHAKAQLYLESALDTYRQLHGEDHEETLEAARMVATCHLERSQFATALGQFETALQRSRDSLGADHQVSLEIANGLGLTLYHQGRWSEAEDLLSDTLERQRRIHGDHHSESLSVLNNLAMVYQAQGKMRQAEDYYSRIIEISAAIKGADHPHTLSTTVALGSLHRLQGHHEDAIRIVSQALDSMSRVLGDDHPTTISAAHELGICLSDSGRASDAVEALHQVMETCFRRFGEQHLQTLYSVHSLAMALQEAGRFDEALTWAERSLRIAEVLLGDRHPDLAHHMLAIARNLEFQRKLPDAEAMYRRIHEFQLATLGEEHPDNHITLNNLANVLQAMGKNEESIAILHQLVEIRRESLGPDHPQTLTSMNNLGLALLGLRRMSEAEEILERTWQVRSRVLGPEHPDTVTALNNIGTVFYAGRQYAKAEEIFSEVTEIRSRILDERHPSFIVSVRNLAWAMHKQGRLADAQPLFDRVLELRVAALGDNHTDSIHAMRELAGVFNDLKMYDSAAKIYLRALEATRSATPEDTQMITMTKAAYADALGRTGEADSAEGLLLEAYQELSAAVGNQNPRTQRVIQWLIDFYSRQERPDDAQQFQSLVVQQ